MTESGGDFAGTDRTCSGQMITTGAPSIGMQIPTVDGYQQGLEVYQCTPGLRRRTATIRDLRPIVT